MKPSFASSYPVHACANEAGIDYALALAWVDAVDNSAKRATRQALHDAHGEASYAIFQHMIMRAYDRGLVRVRRFAPPAGDGWSVRAGAAS